MGAVLSNIFFRELIAREVQRRGGTFNNEADYYLDGTHDPDLRASVVERLLASVAHKPRLIDLYCKAGGAAKGYADAGWDVVGVDIDPQPRYPFPFIRADVLKLSPRFIATFDAAHASPPCQFATLLKHAPGGKQHANLIPATRKLLKAAGVPYIIENVEPAGPHLINPTTYCGTMFGLRAEGCQLRRHRLFETSFPLSVPGYCLHLGAVIGIYGGHARRRAAKHGGRGTKDVWALGHKGAASAALGVDWMTLNELSEAIPPAYTKHIGEALLAHIASLRAAA